jgi:hypothetical protein
MYEWAEVQHVKFKWIGRVIRNAEGRFYNPDTIRFWVRWEIGTSATGQLPEPGWYPGADIVRLV